MRDNKSRNRKCKYRISSQRPDSIGKLRKFYGVPAVLVRAYAYIRSLGPDGARRRPLSLLG